MVAHAPTRTGKGHSFADQVIGLAETPLGDQGYIPLDVNACRAGVLAGRDPALVDGKDVGHGLGKGAVDGRALRQPLFELAGHAHRADLDAVVAAGADVLPDIARLAPHGGREIANVPLEFFHLAVAEQGDVGVVARVDHLGGQDAGRAVKRRKGLVELGHVPADGGLAFDQVDVDAGLGDVECGLDAGHAAAHDQRRLGHRHALRKERVVPGYAFHGCGDQVDRLFCGQCVGRVRPGDMLAYVGHLEQVGIEARVGQQGAPGALVHARRAGRDHDTVQLVFLNVLLDARLSRSGAGVLVDPRDHDVFHVGNGIGHHVYVYRAGDVAAAHAHIYPNARLVWIHQQPSSHCCSGRSISTAVVGLIPTASGATEPQRGAITFRPGDECGAFPRPRFSLRTGDPYRGCGRAGRKRTTGSLFQSRWPYGSPAARP